MNIESVKAKIIKKFGSVTRFCSIAGINYQNVNNIFRRSESEFKQIDLALLAKLVKETKDKALGDLEITQELIDQIKTEIRKDGQTYLQFCQAHGFTNTWLSSLINGKHKLISLKVKKVCTILKIKY